MSAATELRLGYAERMITQSGVWARCSTWLIRLALESALAELWDATQPQLRDCSTRAQLIALHKFCDRHTARHTADLWHALSRAAHHHPYELAPTTGEIRGWLAEARTLIAAL